MKTGEDAEACRPASVAYAEVNRRPYLKVEARTHLDLSFNVSTQP